MTLFCFPNCPGNPIRGLSVESMVFMARDIWPGIIVRQSPYIFSRQVANPTMLLVGCRSVAPLICGRPHKLTLRVRYSHVSSRSDIFRLVISCQLPSLSIVAGSGRYAPARVVCAPPSARPPRSRRTQPRRLKAKSCRCACTLHALEERSLRPKEEKRRTIVFPGCVAR